MNWTILDFISAFSPLLMLGVLVGFMIWARNPKERDGRHH